MRRMLLALCLALAPLAATAQDAAPAAEPLTLKALLEKGEGDVRARLGEPDVARREDGGALWTYRLPRCALYVFFRTAGREGLRVVGASTGPRRHGEAAPDVDACLAVTGTT